MGKVVSLNKFRKQKAKEAAKEAAEVNRMLHGRSKTDKTLDESVRNKEERELDGKKRDETTTD